jgi:putative FmdB family regulatory protein
LTYTYVCDRCKLFFEKKHKMTENPIYKCPKCGKELKRIITGGNGIIFKGDGWTHAGKKDANYNRDRKMESMREGRSPDPYSGYRNWDEEK